MQQGQAENLWSVGDTTDWIWLNGTVSTCEFDSYKCKAILIGFDHNKDLETNGKYSITLQFGQDENGVNICFSDSNHDGDAYSNETGFRINSSNTNAGGWESSWMRNDICPQFLELLPTDLQNAINTVTKYTDNVGGENSNVESSITATKDKVFLLAFTELYDSASYVNSYEINYTKRYSEMYGNNSSRIRYQHYDINTIRAWWTRSPYYGNNTYFFNVGQSGGYNYAQAYTSRGFSPAVVIY